MKVKKGFLMRELADSYVVVSIDQVENQFNGMIQLNKTGAFLWNQMKNDCTKESLIESLLEQYEVTREVAEDNVTTFLEKLMEAGVLCE